ncbi:MAG: CDP-alcohol phosphatidyltransferase family protein [Chthoniobacterales bacterium]
MNERAEQTDKPDEITELSDLYFFRPAGSVLANVAAKVRLTPSQVTIIAGVVGMIGGAFLYSRRWGWVGFALLLFHGALDSADGQLARKIGQTSEFGRVLDGVAGYVTHTAMFIGLAAGHIARGGSRLVLLWMAFTGLASIAHAQAYDYYRTTYAAIVNTRRIRRNEPKNIEGWLHAPYTAYSRMQRFLTGSHDEVVAELNTRAQDGVVTEDDRQHYRGSFRPLVRGWNLLGDNTRRYAAGAAVLFQRADLFFAIVLLPMNLIFIVMTIWQRRTDRRFLAER